MCFLREVWIYDKVNNCEESKVEFLEVKNMIIGS